MIELGGLIKAGLSLAVCGGIIGILVRGFKLTSKDKKDGGSSSSNSNSSNIGGSK